MSFGENALKAGGIAAGGVFFACCFIPVVGALVGVVAGGLTFVVVETGAVIGYGGYKAVKGLEKACHCSDKHKKKETYTDDVSHNSDWIQLKSSKKSKVSVTQFNLHKESKVLPSQSATVPHVAAFRM